VSGEAGSVPKFGHAGDRGGADAESIGQQD
jgi:hypothetical protein